MRLNKKFQYGLLAVIELALHDSVSGLLQKDISERQKISIKYLDKIVSDLKSAGIIKSFEGKGSGYVLAKNPATISIYDVYRAFEGDLMLVQYNNDSDSSAVQNTEASREFWKNFSNQIESIMKETSIAELADRQRQYFFFCSLIPHW